MIDKEFLKTLTILYVEDDVTIQKSLSIILSKVFVQIYICNNGVEALEVFKTYQNNINAIISDINMTQLNGLDLAQQLKENAAFKNKPILILTTESSAEMKARGKSIGVTGWLVKPFSNEKLTKAISMVLGL